jgi:beta-phosphoglucomutase-like phosphatase (HAD superfamily)
VLWVTVSDAGRLQASNHRKDIKRITPQSLSRSRSLVGSTPMQRASIQSFPIRAGLGPLTPCAQSMAQLAELLVQHKIKAVLLDWDGCVMSVNGRVHGDIAIQALQRSQAWLSLGISLSSGDGEAAYVGDAEKLAEYAFRVGSRTPISIAPHGVPWDELMTRNLLAPVIDARQLDPVHAMLLRGEFLSKLDEAARAVELDKVPGASRLQVESINPGCREFLEACLNRSLPVHVVTMTPTSMVNSFIRQLRLSAFIASAQGCDQFSREEFPMAKHSKHLWIESAKRVGFATSDCAVVEDNSTNIEAALDAGCGALVGLSGKTARLLQSRSASVKLDQALFAAPVRDDWRALERVDLPALYHGVIPPFS